jgi:Carboxypeptidase regulatory-like domain
MKYIITAITALIIFLTFIASGETQDSGSIKGQVYDDIFGLRYENEEVQVISEGKVIRSVRTDNDGRYKVENLPTGHYTILVEASTASKGKSEIALKANQNLEVDVVVIVGKFRDKSPFKLRGKVRIENKTAVADATIVVMRPFNSELILKTKTDASGNYEADIIDNGQYVVYAYKPGYTIGVAALFLPEIIKKETKIEYKMEYKIDFNIGLLNL